MEIVKKKMNNLKKLRTFFKFTQDELAQKISFNKDTIVRYESGNLKPSFNALLKLSKLYRLSFDYLVLNNECFYPKNLNFINLAVQLDQTSNSQTRNHIKITIKKFLDKIQANDTEIKLDSIETDLTQNFHKNLKQIRKFRKIQQNELAKCLEITPALLGMYEVKNYPPIDKIITISKKLNCSVHTIATGEKLFFNFQDRSFGKTVLLADHFLTLEDQKIIIKLMEIS